MCRSEVDCIHRRKGGHRGWTYRELGRPTVIVVWRGLDAFPSEYADVRIDGQRLFAHGAQVGIEPKPYLLRYQLEPGRLAVEIDNSIPVLRDGLHRGGTGREYLMSWVSVPDLAVEESMQRYEPLAPGRIRFHAGDFVANIELGEDGLVRRYEGLAERMA